jgi:hypothetical protein
MQQRFMNFLPYIICEANEIYCYEALKLEPYPTAFEHCIKLRIKIDETKRKRKVFRLLWPYADEHRTYTRHLKPRIDFLNSLKDKPCI